METYEAVSSADGNRLWSAANPTQPNPTWLADDDTYETVLVQPAIQPMETYEAVSSADGNRLWSAANPTQPNLAG